jgi:hypothetical protein
VLISVATGLGALCVLLVAWVTVQIAWRRAFPAADGDPDALSGRLGCLGRCAPNECRHACSASASSRAGEDDE